MLKYLCLKLQGSENSYSKEEKCTWGQNGNGALGITIVHTTLEKVFKQGFVLNCLVQCVENYTYMILR